MDTATTAEPIHEAPVAVEQDKPFDLRSHLEPVGLFDGVELFTLDVLVELEWSWGSQTFYPGIYWFDECEWLRVPIDHERQERRRVVREARRSAAKLANNHPGSAEEFTAKAEAVFRFLIKE